MSQHLLLPVSFFLLLHGGGCLLFEETMFLFLFHSGVLYVYCSLLLHCWLGASSHAQILSLCLEEKLDELVITVLICRDAGRKERRQLWISLPFSAFIWQKQRGKHFSVAQRGLVQAGRKSLSRRVRLRMKH